MRRPVVLEGRQHYVTVSIGVAVSPPSDAEELLARADAAMYEAKARGRDRVGTSPDRVIREKRERLVIATELRRALETDGLALHYQPIVELATGRAVGVEALCRWTHPELGVVAPERFVAVAEATGLVGMLDRWVLLRAASDARALVEHGLLGPHGRLAVNLSVQSIDAGLEELVDGAVDGVGVLYEALAIEVTETGVMADPDAAAATLRRLRDRGLGVHIDDFGTGYSSLNYLRRLPITGIKIDRSFIQELGAAPDDLAITMSIIDLSQSLGVRVIAEGVENQQQLALLREHGCWAGQGYLWSPALPLPALMKRLGRFRGPGPRG
jgi:EAL domain-containing protein (putative c-di-GMP-specific phosphodiesterase class I)